MVYAPNYVFGVNLVINYILSFLFFSFKIKNFYPSFIIESFYFFLEFFLGIKYDRLIKIWKYMKNPIFGAKELKLKLK